MHQGQQLHRSQLQREKVICTGTVCVAPMPFFGTIPSQPITTGLFLGLNGTFYNPFTSKLEHFTRVTCALQVSEASVCVLLSDTLIRHSAVLGIRPVALWILDCQLKHQALLPSVEKNPFKIASK